MWWANGWAKCGWIFSSLVLASIWLSTSPLKVFVGLLLVPEWVKFWIDHNLQRGRGPSMETCVQGSYPPKKIYWVLVVSAIRVRISLFLLGTELFTDGLEILLGVCWSKCQLFLEFEKNLASKSFPGGLPPFLPIFWWGVWGRFVLLKFVKASYLVDPSSSHMLVSKIKPCMSKYNPLEGETAKGSLNHT